MGVQGAEPASVVEDDDVAVRARRLAGGHDARRGRVNRRAGARAQVETGMEPRIASHGMDPLAVGRAEDSGPVRGQGPDERLERPDELAVDGSGGFDPLPADPRRRRTARAPGGRGDLGVHGGAAQGRRHEHEGSDGRAERAAHRTTSKPG
jgi:hypothetical protein